MIVDNNIDTHRAFITRDESIASSRARPGSASESASLTARDSGFAEGIAIDVGDAEVA